MLPGRSFTLGAGMRKPQALRAETLALEAGEIGTLATVAPNASATTCGAMPNPSLKLTRYGRHCKPGLRHTVHPLSPGLQRLPPRAA